MFNISEEILIYLHYNLKLNCYEKASYFTIFNGFVHLHIL